MASIAAQPERFSLLVASARRTYTRTGLTVADSLSKVWAKRAASPYAMAVADVDGTIAGRGALSVCPGTS